MTSAFDLNLRHLRGVSAIVASGSVSAAAGIVSLSQPALTQGLAKIEARLSAALFVRRPSGVVATPAGHAMAARADEAGAHLTAAMRAVRRGAVRGFAHPEQLLTMAQIRALLALADMGSYVAAAVASGLSQPALHRAVRDVERVAGVRLVERRGRGTALTEAGVRTARGFRLAIGALEAGLAEIGSLAGDGGGGIAIGAMPLAHARLLPDAMAALHVSHPGARMAVVEGAHRELIDQLRDGRIDLTIGALRDPAPGPDVVQELLFVDTLAVVARARHPLVTARSADAAALAAYPWIVSPAGTPLRDHWERMIAGIDAARPAAPIECGSVMTIRRLLLSADYLTLLSADQVWLELDSGLLGIVRGALPAPVRMIGITTRADWRPTDLQAGFVTMLRRIARGTVSENQ